jgi:LuxR family maltose regulon positive regulatory protein
MAVILLQSKMGVPPLRRPAVARMRLLEYCSDGLVEADRFLRRLTLISAPAGYGKTTMAVEWLNALGYPVAWLSLDEGDSDPSRFVSYFLLCIQSILPEFGNAIMNVVQSPKPPPAEVLFTLLLKELEDIPERLVLVLDDYHTIGNLIIHQQISFLLEHLPPRIHIVVITREDPLIPISRLRSRNELLEIRQENLRFTLDETAEFMRQVMRVRLSEAEILALERRTEGWIAGLQLLGITLHGIRDKGAFIREFTGSHRFILDYLMEEVVNRQTGDMRNFLLQTSILERLCGPLCDAVTDKVGSSKLLENLEKGNMFIVPLDKTRTWYRYHHLFSELLRHQQKQLGQATQIASLHQRASQWFESEGYIPEAIEHALAGQDWTRAAQLIGQANERMFKHGEAVTLAGWLERFPREMILVRADFCLTYAWALLLTEKYAQAGPVLAQAEKLADPGSVLLGQVATAQAYLARSINDNENVIRASQLALALLPESDLVSRSNLYMNLGLVYWHEGKLAEAEQVLYEALEKAKLCGNFNAQLTAEIFLARTLASRGALHEAERRFLAIIRTEMRVPIIALVYFDLCTIYYEWDELEKAEVYLQEGLEICQRTGSTEFLIAGKIMEAYLRLACQDWQAAAEVINRVWRKAGTLSYPVRKRCAAAQALVALAMGDHNLAAQWLESAEEVDAHPFYRFVGLIRPRLLIAQGRLEQARESLRISFEETTRAGWGYGLVAVKVLQALAADSSQAAQEHICEALILAEPEGYMRTFVEAGIKIVPILGEAAKNGNIVDYIGRILAAMGVKQSTPKAKQIGLVEPLSEREVEVLRLVCAGLSNRNIASRLFISPGTVKTHIHNIYGKLGVQNRIQAAARAKELGLD